MKYLIKNCRKLDRKAQREMVDRLSPYLFNVVSRYSPNREDAKDLLQDSLIAIFNNIDACKADDEYPFLAWCKRIAVNQALGKKRKKSLEIEQLNEHGHEKHRLPAIDGKMHMDDVLQLLDRLPDKQRLVFNLVVLDGYNHRDVAELLNINESSSRTYLTRARATLQEVIIKYEMK